MHTSPMLAKLHVETRRYHADLDASWIDLVVPHVSRGQYIEQLTRVLGFESAVEAALAYTPGFASMLNLRDWARSSFIARDLMALGLPASVVAQLPQCSILPFVDASEALGWMYVLERATLLHEGLRIHIEQHLPTTPYICSYLAASEGKDLARWSEFGEILERASKRQPTASDDMIRGAHDGCQAAIAWSQRKEHTLRSVG